jgi:hypothetical protein
MKKRHKKSIRNPVLIQHLDKAVPQQCPDFSGCSSRKPISSAGIELQQRCRFISHNVFINPGTRCVLGFKIQFKDCEVQRLQLFCVELPQIDAVTYYITKFLCALGFFIYAHFTFRTRKIAPLAHGWYR